MTGPTLAEHAPVPSDLAAAIVGTLAAAIADGHAADRLHGPIDASSVPVGDADGDPPAPTAPLGWGPEDDVAELGRLLRFAVLGDDGHARLLLARRGSGAADPRTALLQLAAAATDPDPGARPTAAELADALLSSSHRPARRGSHPDGHRGAGRRTIAVLAAGAAVVALLVAGAAARRSPDETSTATSASGPPSTRRRPTPPTAIHLDATASPVRVVEHDGRRYEVGSDGDVVLLGRWSCDDVETPLILRPVTGEVYVWQGWASTGVPSVESPSATVEGGVSVGRADADGDGCPEAVVSRGPGRRPAVLHLGRPRSTGDGAATPPRSPTTARAP